MFDTPIKPPRSLAGTMSAITPNAISSGSILLFHICVVTLMKTDEPRATVLADPAAWTQRIKIRSQ